MQHLKRSRLAIVLTLLTGCAGLIGVPDLTLEEDGSDGGPPTNEAGSSGSDGQVRVDASNADARADAGTLDADSGADTGADSSFDAATCDLSKISSDKNNCGACGHVCLDNGDCNSGVCSATVITTIKDTEFAYMVEKGDYLYLSSVSSFAPNDVAGIWRVHKTTGEQKLLLNTWRADDLVVLGNTLYFITYDQPFSLAGTDVDDWGGLWACDISTSTPCTPRLIQELYYAEGITAGNGKIYTADDGNDAIRSYDPALDQAADGGAEAGLDASSAFATVGTHPNIPATWRLFVEGADVYYLLALLDHPQLGKLNANGNGGTTISKYDHTNAQIGQLVGNKTDVFFTAQDTDVTTGGLVRRVSRAGGAVCDYAGGPATDGTTSISRPRGLYIDDKRIYWTNRGKFDLSGTFISTCDLAGCCTQAKVLWNEGGDARAITGDDKYIYWVETESGQILKVGKP